MIIFKKYLLIILSLIIIFCGLFYWYEWRPTRIKHDCSWVEKHSNFIPEVTQKQVDEENTNCLKIKNDNSNKFNKYLTCDKVTSPAQPAKTWWEKASKNEYDFCIHEKGL